jgi:hypothetical protein
LPGGDCWGGLAGAPAELRFAEAEGSFMAGAAVGGKLGEGVEQRLKVGLVGGFAGEGVGDRTRKACDRALFTGCDFDGLQLVTLNDNVVVNPLQEVFWIGGFAGEVVPAAQVAMGRRWWAKGWAGDGLFAES